MGWMMLEVQGEGKPKQIALLKSVERKGGRVGLACLRNLILRFSISGALLEFIFSIAM